MADVENLLPATAQQAHLRSLKRPRSSATRTADQDVLSSLLIPQASFASLQTKACTSSSAAMVNSISTVAGASTVSTAPPAASQMVNKVHVTSPTSTSADDVLSSSFCCSSSTADQRLLRDERRSRRAARVERSPVALSGYEKLAQAVSVLLQIYDDHAGDRHREMADTPQQCRAHFPLKSVCCHADEPCQLDGQAKSIQVEEVRELIKAIDHDERPLKERGGCVGLLSSSSSSSSLSSQEVARLESDHWLEVADRRHRYGTALRPYYDVWLRDSTQTGESFFQFLDEGSGKDLDLADHIGHTDCKYAPSVRLKKRLYSRDELELYRLEYCDAEQRKEYVAEVKDGKLVWANNGREWKKGEAVDSGTPGKWIFVMDMKNRLYVNRKRKGQFHHSCFMAGGVVRAAGRLVVNDGRVVMLAPYSGHYKPTTDSIRYVIDVLGNAGLDNVSSIRTEAVAFSEE